MDNALVRGPRYAVNCSILFTELPLLERPAAAKAAGFDAVELWWPFESAVPDDEQVERFERAIRNAGVELVGLNFAAGDMPGGDRGLVSWPERSRGVPRQHRGHVGIGERLGCRAFNALYGNRVDGVDPAAQDDLGGGEPGPGGIRRGHHRTARSWSSRSAEPTRYPLLTAADAVDVITRVEHDSGVSNVGLLADLYHLAVNGDDVDKVIARRPIGSRTFRSPTPRGATNPAPATLPILRQVEDLYAGGYDGWVGLEYKPSEHDRPELRLAAPTIPAATTDRRRLFHGTNDSCSRSGGDPAT